MLESLNSSHASGDGYRRLIATCRRPYGMLMPEGSGTAWSSVDLGQAAD